MSAGTEWRAEFLGVMAHLKARGWDRPFIMVGRTLRAPGLIENAVWVTIANDN
jgi:hypothetical protein